MNRRCGVIVPQRKPIMGVVGEIDRLAITAWAPAGLGGGYIATGTFAGAIDPSFASGASLELLSVDVLNSRLTVATDCKTSEKFCSLSWSYPLRAHPGGLIAGGLNDGTVRVWDAAVLLRSPKTSDDEDKGVVFGGTKFQKKHEGAVRCLDFNPFSPHLLASGGTDTKLFVWDLSNPANGPAVRPPGAQQMGSGPSDEVTALRWNRRVQHVLGTGTAAGVLRIWDLKQRRQVISIPSPGSRMRCSGIHWHPDIATQVLTTCDQDNGFGALLWDLRSPAQPVKTFEQFASRGVTCASWCTHDTEMILLATRDPRNAIVSSTTGQVLCELQSPPAPNFDVQWSPRIPGMYLQSSIDGRLTVKSLLTADASRSVSVETANALAESFGEMATGFASGMSVQSPRIQGEERKAVSISRPPKWLRRPVSIAFGSTGYYASVSSAGGSSATVAPCPKYHAGLRESISGLDAILIDTIAADPAPAESLCREYITKAENKDESMGFEVLCCLLQKNSRNNILKYLGYDTLKSEETSLNGVTEVYGLLQSSPLASPLRTSSANFDEGSEHANGNVLDETSSVQDTIVTNKLLISGPAPWDDVGDNHADSILDGDDSNIASGNGHAAVLNKVDVNGSTKNEFEGLSESVINATIRKALVVGDLEKAVLACLHVGRICDALVIAQAGGPSLWRTAQSHYLASLEAEDGGNLITAVTGPQSKMDEFMRSVDNQSKDSWKEALALILTYVPGKDLKDSCSALGQRLLLSGRNGPALVCFLCAGNTKMAVSTWMQNRPSDGSTASAAKSRAQLLTALVRKVRLITAATLLGMGEQNIGTVRALDEMSGRVLCEFGGLLLLEGEVDLAVTYLSNLDPEVTSIYGSAEDIHAKAYAAQPNNTEMYSQNQYSQTTYGQSATGMDGYSGVQNYQPPTQAPVQNWNYPSPVSTTMNGGLTSGNSLHAPPLPPPAAPGAQHPSYATTASNQDRSVYNPSFYQSAPSYDRSAYAAPTPPAPAPVPLPAATPSVPQPVAPSAPMLPPPMPGAVVPSYPTMAPPQSMQPMQSYMGTTGNTAPHAVSQPMPPPPPPPPAADTVMPTSYHQHAKPGSGHSLPPSAEIAVAEQRRQKPLSVSSTPGGPPRRSHSSSSSLSSIGNEPSAYLDKADVGAVPADQQVIVKSLRGAYAYAQKRNNTLRYRKKMEDVNKKLGRLVIALSKGMIDPEIVPLLINVGQCIEKGNYDSATTVVSTLTRQYWDNNAQWIQALKRLIDSVLTGR